MEGTPFLIGLALIVAGGVMEGSFSLPLKVTPKWEWENIWGAGSLMAFVLVPWPLAVLTVPRLGEVYASASWASLLAAVCFGAGWGAGGIFFGLGLNALGLSLGLSLIMGLIAISGSIIPLLMEHPEQLTRPAGLVLMGGIALMVVGISTCAVAGQMKARAAVGPKAEGGEGRHEKPSFKLGLFYCIAAGVLSALVNFGLIFGGEIAAAASRHGADPADANNATWALVFSANYLVNVAYCVYLLRKRGTFGNFVRRGTGAYWAGAVVMGLLWAGGIVVYGIGATRVGQFGAFLGFPVMLISSILTGNLLGAATGEWRGVARQPRMVMSLGVVLLIMAIGVLAYSNQLIS
jgi:L-rhamnose-H+ transport protein